MKIFEERAQLRKLIDNYAVLGDNKKKQQRSFSSAYRAFMGDVLLSKTTVKNVVNDN